MAPTTVPEAAPAKRQRTEGPAKSAEADGLGIERVLDVEILIQKLLFFLDPASTASFAEVLSYNTQWRAVLQQNDLWEELLEFHFHGPRDVRALPETTDDSDSDGDADINSIGGSGDEEEDDQSDDEADGEVDDEESVGNGVQATPPPDEGGNRVAASNSNGSVADTDAGDNQSNQDPQLESAAAADAVSSTSNEPVASNGAAASTSFPTLAGACDKLTEFLRSTDEWLRFDANVLVVEGDIGDIATLGEHAIDGIAFPTTSYLRNPGIGSAAVVFRRAGQGLSDYVRQLDVHLDVGQVHVTPGFDSGADKLIHVVGPSRSHRACYPLLQRTYTSIMRAAEHENLRCVAMTSISTGNLGVPCTEGAQTALRAIQNFLRFQGWSGCVGIVCFEPQTFDAFTQEKQTVLDTFNVTPPFPEHEAAPWF